MGEVFISYSQNFEDVILYRALKGVDKGFYIDVGAWDPVVDSVTKAFYDRGWRGINIEPVRAFYEKLLADRPEDVNLMVAVGSRNGLVRFFEVVDTGLSTTNEELAKRYMQEGYEVRELLVPCMRLADICKDYGVQEVHFLKIDVEGAEKEVLEGFDFSRIRPWIVIVEATEASTQKETFKDWESLLLDQDYEFVYYDGLNRFYVARERSELKEAFKLPPNLWDGFVRYHEWKLQREVEHAQAEREALARQVEELREVVRRAEAERISQEAQLAELSRALNALQAEKEKLWAEREALARQVEELDRWLKAVYATVSWRITAPLRMAKTAAVSLVKGVRGILAKSGHRVSKVIFQLLAKIARWAARNPRLRSLGKKVLSKSPGLQVRVRRLIVQERLTGPAPQGLSQAEEIELPQTVREVLEELRRSFQQASS
jgi:FkbM family methyltransferase